MWLELIPDQFSVSNGRASVDLLEDQAKKEQFLLDSTFGNLFMVVTTPITRKHLSRKAHKSQPYP